MTQGSPRAAFRPRWAPTLAVLALLPLLLWLGTWQLDRAGQKHALVAAHAVAGVAQPVAYAADLPRFTRVVVRGRWDVERQFLLDATVHEGQVGFRALTPLVLASGGTLLVDRGWVAGDPSRRALPDIAFSVAGEAEVVGLIDALPRPGLASGAVDVAPGAGWPRVVLYPSRAELEAALGGAIEPGLLRLDPAAPNGLARGFAPDFGVSRERHLAYATTWFALAATLVIIWILLHLRRREPTDER